jgi:hypothetical protein
MRRRGARCGTHLTSHPTIHQDIIQKFSSTDNKTRPLFLFYLCTSLRIMPIKSIRKYTNFLISIHLFLESTMMSWRPLPPACARGAAGIS